MFQLMFISLMIMNSFLFTQMTHPMSMGMILLIQTLMTCVYTGLMTKSFWFSYILFLIFIGGLLILFIYMASLASNEKVNFNYLFMIKMLMLLIIIMMLMLMMDKFYMLNFFNNMEMNKFNTFILIKENFLSLSKMYESPNNMIIILLINYLLLTLIAIVKITFKFNGPLRPKYY